MLDKIEDYTSSLLMKVYHTARHAKLQNDIQLLNHLKNEYPYVFTLDCEKFMKDVICCVEIIRKTTGEDYIGMFEPKNDFIETKLVATLNS